MLLDVIQRLSSHGDLDCRQDRTYVVDWLCRPYQKMNMLGHDDIGPDVERVLPTPQLYSVDKPLPRVFSQEKGFAAKARESEFVGVPLIIIALALFKLGAHDLGSLGANA
jgi:hypothetical protein